MHVCIQMQTKNQKKLSNIIWNPMYGTFEKLVLLVIRTYGGTISKRCACKRRLECTDQYMAHSSVFIYNKADTLVYVQWYIVVAEY